MNILLATFRLSLSVLLKSRRTLVMGMLCCFPILGAALGAAMIASGIAEHDLSAYGLITFLMSRGYVHFFLVVVTLFYGTALVADEIDDKTITYLFMRPVPKTSLYLGKYLAYLAAAGLMLLPTATASFLVAILADPPGEAIRHFPTLFQDLAVLALGILAYGALYALIGAISRRPVFVGLGFAVIWETAVTFIPGYLSKLTIKHYLLALLPHPAGQRGVLALLEAPTSKPLAVFVLLAVTAALLALGTYVFKHKEYVLEQ
ncbi:MAG: ABC transporter permease [Acidobacteriota bacterium]